MNVFRGIRWKIVSTYIFAILITLSVLGHYLTGWTESFFVDTLKSDLLVESRLVGRMALPMIAGHPEQLDHLAKSASSALGRRITIIRSDGFVLGDSHHDFRTMESHKDRPEFQQALKSGSGYFIRKSATIKSPFLYVATNISDGTRTLAVARVAESLYQVDHMKSVIAHVFLLTTLLAIALAIMVSYTLAIPFAQRILAMNAAAWRYARGEFSINLRVPDKPRDEVDELAVALNSMSSEIRSMMDQLAQEKNLLETILARTDDGLVVVDKDGKIRMVNPAAERLLGTSFNQIEGKTVIEGTFSHDLSELTTRVLRTQSPATLEVELSSPEEAHLNVYVASLERSGGHFGAMIVMHDLSETRRIDSIRQDFVANVSHELRTPLASIRAMAETIAVRGRKDPDAAQRFAERIMTEADRLTALSEDLLDLAKIEAGLSIVRQDKFPLSEVVDRVSGEFEALCDKKGITLSSSIPPDINVTGDHDAVYQILVNLVDNAMKYTPQGGKVIISATSNGDRVDVKVSDTGIGIPAGDSSRVFERFYRVDKARSRDSGGTGLGLSIVKHLVEAHGGRVTVDSTPGLGTTFTFNLLVSP